ncbi:hypothetical protein Ddc_24140 [Ditylenchus destructor]|nr:hypothetical protein Ddc_24140 [Ditylenchus destructor]
MPTTAAPMGFGRGAIGSQYAKASRGPGIPLKRETANRHPLASSDAHPARGALVPQQLLQQRQVIGQRRRAHARPLGQVVPASQLQRGGGVRMGHEDQPLLGVHRAALQRQAVTRGVRQPRPVGRIAPRARSRRRAAAAARSAHAGRREAGRLGAVHQLPDVVQQGGDDEAMLRVRPFGELGALERVLQGGDGFATLVAVLQMTAALKQRLDLGDQVHGQSFRTLGPKSGAAASLDVRHDGSVKRPRPSHSNRLNSGLSSDERHPLGRRGEHLLPFRSPPGKPPQGKRDPHMSTNETPPHPRRHPGARAAAAVPVEPTPAPGASPPRKPPLP